VVVEKSSPYCVTVARSTEEFFDAGLVDLYRNLNGIEECLERGEWPYWLKEYKKALSIRDRAIRFQTQHNAIRIIRQQF